MRIYKMFRFRKNSPTLMAVMLVVGVVLSVGGSVWATSIGSNVTVTSVLTVSGRAQFDGNVGLGTSTPGTLFSVQGTGNWANAASSTLYTALVLPRITATSTVLFATSDGSVGIATTSPGSLFSIQGIGNFVTNATSTLYSTLRLPSFSATSTSATSTLSTGGLAVGTTHFVVQQNSGWVGIGTSTPGSLFSVHGIANWTSDATSTLYSTLRLPNFAATSTSATSTLSTGGFAVGTTQFVVQQNSGSVGIGTSTPGSIVGIQGVANFVQDATSTVYSGFASPSFSATSTSATTSISTGGFQVGRQGNDSAAAFTVLQSATTSVGIGTSTPRSHQLAVSGNALIGAGSNGTSTLTISSSGTNVGSCIELKATDGTYLRIYATSSPSAAQAYTNAGGGRGFEKLVIEAGGCR